MHKLIKTIPAKRIPCFNRNKNVSRHIVNQVNVRNSLGDEGILYDFDGLVGVPCDAYDFIIRYRGAHGSQLVINNPRRYNRITGNLAVSLRKQLHLLNNTPLTRLIVLRGAHTRSFCNGTDIFDLYQSVEKKNLAKASETFLEAYKLTYYLSNISTPIMSLLNGTVYSGGISLSGFSNYQVVTPGTTICSPDVQYGFFPDNGTTFLFNQLNENPDLPGFGTFMALTGISLTDTDIINVGLGTHMGSIETGKAAIEALDNCQVTLTARIAHEQISSVLNTIANDGEFTFHRDIDSIAKHFYGKTRIEDIIHSLEGEESYVGKDFAEKCLAAIRNASPLSIKLTMKSLELGRDLDLPEVLTNDHRVGMRLIQTKDFHEGMQYLYGYKKEKPNWSFSRVEDVNDRLVERFFEPLNWNKDGCCDIYPEDVFREQELLNQLEKYIK